MLFELEGEAPRVIKAGEAFWEPGRDVIHYSDANNRTDIPLRFVVTMMCVPGQQMLTLVHAPTVKAARAAERLAAKSDEAQARRVLEHTTPISALSVLQLLIERGQVKPGEVTAALGAAGSPMVR